MKRQMLIKHRFVVSSFSWPNLKYCVFGLMTGSYTECPQDRPKSSPSPSPTSKNNDIVPIAVGCALAGLVLIVLIAYVIGRRKSHSGYEKV